MAAGKENLKLQEETKTGEEFKNEEELQEETKTGEECQKEEEKKLKNALENSKSDIECQSLSTSYKISTVKYINNVKEPIIVVYAICKLDPKIGNDFSLMLVEISNDKNFQRVWRFKALEDYCKKLDPNIKLFELYFLPNERWNGKIEIILMYEGRENKGIKSISDPLITIDISFQYTFLFGFKIHSKSNEKSKVNTNDIDSLQELSIYTDFLLNSNNWEEKILMLIEQFNTKYKNGVSSKNIENFFQVVNWFLCRNPSLTVNQLFILICLISCIPHSIIQFKELNFLQSEIFLEHSQDLLQMVLSHPYSLEGLVHLMIFNKKANKKDWRNALNCDANDYIKFTILNHFLADLPLVNNFLGPEEKEFIFDKIKLYEIEEFLQLFRPLALNYFNCKEFLSSLQDIFLKMDVITFTDKCWNMLFNYCNLRIKTINDVKNFFEAISSLDKEFKLITYDMQIKTILWNIIEQIKEKKNFKVEFFCYIFKNFYDPFFSDYEYAVKLSENLTLSEICNTFGLNISFFQLFEKWALNITNRNSNIEQIITQFKKEIFLIQDQENINFIFDIFIEKLLLVCIKRKEEFLDCAPYIDDCENDLLRRIYINAELKHENEREIYNKLSDDQKKCIIFEKFSKIHSKHPSNKILITLIDSQLSSMKFNYSEFEFLSALFENPEKQNIWILLINSHEHYEPFEYYQSLLHRLSEIGDIILQENIALYQIDTIKKQTQNKRWFMVFFLESSFRILDKEQQNFFLIIENIVTKRVLIEEYFKSFATFTNRFQHKIKNYQNLEYIYSTFKKESKYVQLAAFSFPDEMKLIINTSWQIGPAIDSFIFNNYYIATIQSHSSSRWNISKIVRKVESVFNKMIVHLTVLFTEINDYPMKNIIKLFSNVKSIENEIAILSSLVPFDEVNKNTLIECIQNYQESENIISACYGIVQLKEIAAELDEFVLESCLEYIEIFPQIDSLNIASYLNISAKVHNLFSANLSKKSKDALIATLQKIGKSKELILFLLDLRKYDIDHMKEGVNEYENEFEFENGRIVYDLENLWYCVRDITKYCSNFSDLCNLFELQRDDGKNFMDVPQQLQICSPQIFAITEMHTEINCKEQAKKKHISEIAKNSAFIIEFENDKYDVDLRYPNNKSTFSLAKLNELKCRAQLIRHTSQSLGLPEDENLKYFPIFVDYIHCINSIITRMNDLYQNGYPDLERILNRKFYCNNGEYENVKQLEEEVFHLFESWENDLSNAYSQFYWLTFLCGKQFWILEDYIVDRNCESNLEAKNILRFMGKRKEINYSEKYDKNGLPGERLLKLGGILKSNVKNSKKKQFDLGERIDSEEKIIFLCTDKYLNGIFSIYKHYVGQFPRASQVIFCKSSTHWRELKSFLYRYLKDPYKTLYSLINCENLSLENQIKFKTLFNQLLEKENIKSGLAIITENTKSYLSQYFKSLTVPKVTRFSTNQFLSDEVIANFIKAIDTKSWVITSSCAGLGKTTNMKTQAITYSDILITFPIGGSVNYSEVCKMISKLNISPEASILHLNISYSSNPKLLNEILINICLFRTLITSENIFVLNRSISVWIEVANSFGNSLFRSIEYLGFLSLCHVDKLEIQRLIVPENTDDPMQVVGRYLSLYEKQQLDNEKELKKKRIISADEMKNLLLNHFINNQSQSEVTYTQVHIFISILNRLLKNFEISPFSPETIEFFKSNYKSIGLEFISEEYNSMRAMIFKHLLESTKEFTTKCISNVKEIQGKSSEKVSKNEIDEINEISALVSRYQDNIKWESSNHFHFIFLDDGSFIPIYRYERLVPESFKKLVFLQNNYSQSGQHLASIIRSNRFDIDDYSNMDHIQLLNKLSAYNKYHVDLGDVYRNDNYVMTPDNFLKMNLIYLRVYSGLPVIIMGETGCGKTSLIQFLVLKVLGKVIYSDEQGCKRENKERLDIKKKEINTENEGLFAKISIHAGTTSEDIREEMKKLVNRAQKISKNDKLWVFFDEFNTTDSIGMICEIMCERTLDGNKLPENMAFLGACNPYRVSSRKIIHENVGFKKEKSIQNQSKLVHVVKPLPETMIDYVWDFGTLTDKDAKFYISTMLNKIQSQHQELFVNMICIAHKYFQEEEDASSVSLRDASRFVDLYIWFKNSIINRCTESPETYRGSTEYMDRLENIELAAGILSFAHCYYLRLASDFDRDTFLHKIVDSLNQPMFVSVQDIKETIEIEQNDYILRMELPKGTAINNALKENIFTIIPCIANKIPVFICGKPGSSKSLSIQLIFSNLRGKRSNDPYFRTLPEFGMVHYQGSETCKSEGIIEVFEKAERYPKIDNRLLPVIVFDEIGLAELSKHNPLKVLHRYLERENINVGFIGISNWRLDASKMNRALYLARPDPDEEDLEITALSIYRSYTVNKAYEHVISSLTKAYAGLKKQTKETEISNFYGLRDFYHMIKYVSANFSKKDVGSNEFILKCVKTAIERNFGGTKHGTAIMCSLFNEYHKINLPEINTRTLDLIKDNLNDPNARYLMLVGQPDISIFLLDKYLDKLNDRRIIVGSRLPNDINQDSYGIESLNDIIIYMELGISIILKDMDHIYSSLYDLFNQSFAIQGSENYERKYCNISIEDNFNPRCYVNPKFHAIALMSPEDVEKTDAPFLNRFEKHYLSIDNLLSSKQIDILEMLESWVNTFFVINEQEVISFTKNHLFPIYSIDTLALLILFNSQEKKKQTLEKCKEILLEIAPSDILVLLEIVSISPDIKETIKNTWKELHNINFQDTIKLMIEDKSDFDKLIAFTYDKRISGKIFNPKDYKKIIIKEMIMFSSKQDLNKEFKAFYKNKDKSIFIIEVDFGEECNHLPLVKFLIDKLNSENLFSKKKFCIVIHIKRNINYSSNLMIFESWKMKMFDFLTPNSFEITNEILSSNTKSLILSEKISDFLKEFEYLVEDCMLSFKAEIDAGKNYGFNNYIANVIKTFRNDPDITLHFKNKIWKHIENANIKKDWRKEIFLNSKLIDDSANLHEAISKSLLTEIESALQLIIYTLEEKGTLLSYLKAFPAPYSEFNDFRKQTWLNIFNSIRIDNRIGLQRLNQGNLLKCEHELYFPFSKTDYKAVVAAFESYKILEINQNPIQTSFESFTEEYHRTSIYKGKIDFNGEHYPLQELYFNDLVAIYLKGNLLNPNHQKVISSLLKIIFHDNESFEEKLISFMKIEELGVLLCHAIDVLLDLNDELDSLLKKLLLNIGSFEINQNENADKNIQKWKIALCSVCKMLIDRMKPHLFNSQNFDLLDYSIKAENLYNLLAEIELNEHISICTLDILEFWVSLSKLISKSNGNQEDILKISKQGLNIPPEEELFIYNEKFAISVFETVGQKYFNSSHYHKFMSSFFKILVNRNSHYIMKIAEELENKNFWQFSTKIMSIIEDASKIKNSIEELKMNISNNVNPDFKVIRNGYLEEIEKVLKIKGISSKFGITLGDRIENSFKEGNQDYDRFYTEGLKDIKFFNYFLKKAKYDDIEFPNTKKLISLILVKNYLDIYCFNLAHKLDDEIEILESIDKTITESDIGDTLKMYCTKKILSIKGCDLAAFMNGYSNINWTRRIKELEEEKKPRIKLNLESFLVFPRISEIYKNNVKVLRNILNNVGDQNEKNQIFTEIQSPDQKLALGIAFLNEIFSIYSKKAEMNTNIIVWFNTKEEVIRKRLGQEFYKLLYCYINNFSKGSDLRLEPNTPEIDLHRILAILGIFTVSLSYHNWKNPISSLFFNENGSTNNLIERFNNRYIFGAEPHPLHKYIQDFKNNFASLISNTWNKNYSKGSTYKCSFDCDYIYTITNCGGPMQESVCPYCRRKIGGKDHILVKREGHVNLTDLEAREFLKSAVIKHRGEAETGLKHFGSLIGEISSIRSLTPISYLAQHFVLSSIIFTLTQLGSIDGPCLEILINSHQMQEPGINCLRRSIKSDYEKLIEVSRSDSGYLWVYKLISSMDELLIECNADPLSPMLRDEFEKKFENKLILPNLNPQSSIASYSNLLKTNFEIQYSLKDYIYEFFNLNEDKNYPYIELFRTKGEPSLENMKNQFLLNQSAKDLRLIDMFLNNSEEIRKIESLYPIIKFTNSLLDIYNHKILRAEAHKIKIGEVINSHPEMQPLYINFLEAWDHKGIERLQYGCKQLKPIKIFNMESPISYFLVDDDSKTLDGGIYMAATLIELAEIQNKYLSELNSIILDDVIYKGDAQNEENSHKKLAKYPLQKLNKNNIISLHVDDIDLLITCSLSNPMYGKGKEIIYDFERMQKLISKKLLLAKYIDTTRIDLIQYQLELLNTTSQKSGLLLEIQDIIPQKILEQDHLYNIELFFNELENVSKLDYPIRLKDIYTSFNYVLCYLQYSKKENNYSIMNFCKKLDSSRICTYLKDKTRISEIKLEYAISLYQIIEAKYFPFTKGFINPEYKLTENANILEASIEGFIKEIDSNLNLYPNKLQIENALMRFIIRNSTASLRPEDKLVTYIVRYDFWDLNVDQWKIDNLYDKFPHSIQISHSLNAYEIFYAKNHKINFVKDEVVHQEAKAIKKKASKSINNWKKGRD